MGNASRNNSITYICSEIKNDTPDSILKVIQYLFDGKQELKDWVISMGNYQKMQKKHGLAEKKLNPMKN